MFDRLKELGKFIDDMEAVKADIYSDEPGLQAHGLGNLASMALDAADKFEKIPGMTRAVAFMRQTASDMLEEKQALEQAVEARHAWVKKVNADAHRTWQRHRREEAKRRTELTEEAEHGEQPDMFGNFTEKGR